MSSTRAPQPSATSWKATQHDDVHILAADGETVGNPVANIGIFLLFVAVTLFIVIRASKKNATAAEFFTAGRVFHRPAERHRDLG